MPEIKITDRISYIPSCEKPISGDVGIVRGDKITYIYDTGSIPETLDFLHSLDGQCDIVISHFHGDHTWWLTPHKRGDEGVEEGDEISLVYERPKFRRLYVGALTKKYIPDGQVITGPTTISSRSGLNFNAEERVISEPINESITEPVTGPIAGPTSLYDGVKVDIYPIPNSHCKGALLMMVDNEYAFIGDSSYCMTKDGKACYNAQLLKEEIELLERIPADKLLVSHDRKFLRDKAVVIRQLKSIYSHRTPESPYIIVK
ncbi:MAG: MBL fold metallo-hydrolase [Lachnospiraceae bacterium]|nr:MBL fold metallo-hydrolase [Lachnospiraceae bacterium]